MKADQIQLLCIKPEKPLFKLKGRVIEQRLLENNRIITVASYGTIISCPRISPAGFTGVCRLV